MEFYHESVMPREVTAALAIKSTGTYVDCTLGGGGHALLVAGKLRGGRVIGIDRDDAAIAYVTERFRRESETEIETVRGNFADLSKILDDMNVPFADGFLFDLGVSSHQIDTAERGFSYMKDAPLDMRMDKRQKLTAYDVVNGFDEKTLARIFREYGEERHAKRIAAAIVRERAVSPIVTTGRLARIICELLPHEKSGHPAKRVFQAVRIEVNNELGILRDAFITAVRRLNPGGRLVVITFHSLEDKIAKHTFRELARGCVCPPNFPVCVCGHKPEIRLVGKAVTADEEETAKNPRAKSAKLRVVERL